MRRRDFITFAGALALTAVAALPGGHAWAESESVVDHISVPGPITFNGETYQLSWSSHPGADYYIQEYLPLGQTGERFEQMVLVNALIGKTTVRSAAETKVAELNKRKATDPLVNFAVIHNDATGEIILDFILSAKDDQGGDIVEWNAYRFAPLKVAGGKTGILLVGISRRAYGGDAMEFLQELKAARPVAIKALAGLPLPKVQLKD